MTVDGPTTMTAENRGLQMSLPARAENVAVVRHVVAGMAEAYGMDETSVGDLKTVVTEACMNVVLHAYDGEEGPLMVDAGIEGTEMAVTVTDFGVGIRPQTGDGRDSLRLGVSLIASLSSSFEIRGVRGKGTRTTMRLPIVTGVEAEPDGAGPEVSFGDPDGTSMRIWDVDVIGAVLARLVSVLGARRDLTVDELADAMLLTDAITADPQAIKHEDDIRLSLADADGTMDLRIGPMPEGAAQRVIDALQLPAELGGSLTSLAKDIEVESSSGREFLLARFAQ